MELLQQRQSLGFVLSHQNSSQLRCHRRVAGRLLQRALQQILGFWIFLLRDKLMSQPGNRHARIRIALENPPVRRLGAGRVTIGVGEARRQECVFWSLQAESFSASSRSIEACAVSALPVYSLRVDLRQRPPGAELWPPA